MDVEGQARGNACSPGRLGAVGVGRRQVRFQPRELPGDVPGCVLLMLLLLMMMVMISLLMMMMMMMMCVCASSHGCDHQLMQQAGGRRRRTINESETIVRTCKVVDLRGDGDEVHGAEVEGVPPVVRWV
jgi:hypothetical protein